MGRGRQKAKQTKVARELKYFSPETNYRQLQEELQGIQPHDVAVKQNTYDDEDDFSDLAAKYADWYDLEPEEAHA